MRRHHPYARNNTNHRRRNSISPDRRHHPYNSNNNSNNNNYYFSNNNHRDYAASTSRPNIINNSNNNNNNNNYNNNNNNSNRHSHQHHHASPRGPHPRPHFSRSFRFQHRSLSPSPSHHRSSSKKRPTPECRMVEDFRYRKRDKEEGVMISGSPSVGSSSPSSSGSDSEGHIPRNTTMIADRYKIKRQLGKGTFGRVFEAVDTKKNIDVAIKCVRNVERYREDALVEAGICWELQKDRDSVAHCAQILRQFEWHGHLCIVFEKLGYSLRKYLRFQRERRPVAIERIRVIGRELCKAMAFLHSKKLTHADLKTDNILFENEDMTFGPPVNIRVKVIDFGAATWDDDKHAAIIQTRHYRAPEVVLGINWHHAADMWSVGCILMELYESRMLFDTHDSIEHIAMMTKLVGPVPKKMVDQASGSCRTWFDTQGRLRWPPPSAVDRASLRRVDRIIPLDRRFEPTDAAFADVMRGMLQIDQDLRITAVAALKMPFFFEGR